MRFVSFVAFVVKRSVLHHEAHEGHEVFLGLGNAGSLITSKPQRLFVFFVAFVVKDTCSWQAMNPRRSTT